MSNIVNINVCIIGCKGVGKTSIVKRITTGLWFPDITTTIAETENLQYYTTNGIMRFHVKEYNEQNSDYLIADAFIGIMDKESEFSATWLKNEIDKINQIRADAPIIVTGVNKCENNTSLTQWKEIFPNAIQCSSKNNYKLDDLFLSVARKITSNKDLKLIEPPTISPPEVMYI